MLRRPAGRCCPACSASRCGATSCGRTPCPPSSRRGRTVSHASTAIPLDGVPKFLEVIRADERLRELDISDLFEFMLFTGCRIGEALGLRWTHVDLDAGTVTFAATVVRTRERGLEVQEHGKSDASNRVDQRSRSRRSSCCSGRTRTEYVFPSVAGKLRDVNEHRSRLASEPRPARVPDVDLARAAEDVRDAARRRRRLSARDRGVPRPQAALDDAGRLHVQEGRDSAEAAEHLDRMFGSKFGRPLRDRSAIRTGKPIEWAPWGSNPRPAD